MEIKMACLCLLIRIDYITEPYLIGNKVRCTEESRAAATARKTASTTTRACIARSKTTSKRTTLRYACSITRSSSTQLATQKRLRPHPPAETGGAQPRPPQQTQGARGDSAEPRAAAAVDRPAAHARERIQARTGLGVPAAQRGEAPEGGGGEAEGHPAGKADARVPPQGHRGGTPPQEAGHGIAKAHRPRVAGDEGANKGKGERVEVAGERVVQQKGDDPQPNRNPEGLSLQAILQPFHRKPVEAAEHLQEQGGSQRQGAVGAKGRAREEGDRELPAEGEQGAGGESHEDQ